MSIEEFIKIFDAKYSKNIVRILKIKKIFSILNAER